MRDETTAFVEKKVQKGLTIIQSTSTIQNFSTSLSNVLSSSRSSHYFPSQKSALSPPSPHPPMVCSTDRSKAVVLVLVLLFVALWFILQGDLFYVLPCVILFLCFSVLLALPLPHLGKRELILVLFVRLFDLCLFGFVDFLFLLVYGKAAVCDCGTSWTFLLPFWCHWR